jgi:hypothetical protein
VSWNFLGAPAYDAAAFRANWKPGFTMGASVQIEMPTGDYSKEHLVNAGTNRWMLRPEIGMSYSWHGWHVDVSASVKLFEDNGNYLGSTIRQDALWQTQIHVLRYFGRGAWLAFDSNYYRGGESSRDAIALDDGLDNARLGLTLSLPLAPRHSLRFSASTGVLARAGTDFDGVGIGYNFVF